MSLQDGKLSVDIFHLTFARLHRLVSGVDLALRQLLLQRRDAGVRHKRAGQDYALKSGDP